MTADFNSLTAKQKKVYATIEHYIQTKGIPPTVREIGELVGEKSPGAVQGILNRLEQKGVIKRDLGMARSIRLASENSQYQTPFYIPEIKKITKRNVQDLLNIYNIKVYRPMPPELKEMGENIFMIDCPDSSLSEHGILNTDKLLVSMDSKIKEGDIVMLLYEGSTLLRLYQKGPQENTSRLTAAGNILGKEIFSHDEYHMIGKVVGKFTKYE